MATNSGMTRWVDRVALVTGASAGIGAALSRKLAENGMIVVGCARNTEAIKKLAEECQGLPGKVVPFQCDVSKENEIEEMFQWIHKNHGGVDVCVNNAGISTPETLLELNATHMRSMLDVNVVGLVLCSSKSVNSMRARGVNDGHIFNINSMSGHRLTGALNFYSATKFAVTAITEGLRRELVAANTRIRVTSISPGLVQTEFSHRTFGEDQANDFYKKRGNVLQAQDIVDSVIYALSAPENAQVCDILIRPTGEPL